MRERTRVASVEKSVLAPVAARKVETWCASGSVLPDGVSSSMRKLSRELSLKVEVAFSTRNLIIAEGKHMDVRDEHRV